jgi:hypothetical protein
MPLSVSAGFTANPNVIVNLVLGYSTPDEEPTSGNVTISDDIGGSFPGTDGGNVGTLSDGENSFFVAYLPPSYLGTGNLTVVEDRNGESTGGSFTVKVNQARTGAAAGAMF